MKKRIFTMGVAVLAVVVAAGSVAEELAIADDDLLYELKQYCEEIAEEDKPADMDINTFVLSCVNEELESMGYAKVSNV